MRETEIIRLLKEKDQRGVEELLLHYGPLIRYILLPILPDPRDQEECVSEIAVRVWEKIGSFDPGRGSWNAWLTAVSRNAGLNHRRQTDREHSDELSEDMPSQEPTPEEVVLRQERQKELERALQAISSQERVLFYRKYYYLQSTRQIASELGITERSVEGRLYRIKKKLRKALGGEERE